MSFIDMSPKSVRNPHSECKENRYTISTVVNYSDMSFGKWLAEKRIAARLTQGALAKRAGISITYVSALERDEPNAKDGSPRRPRLDKVERLAKALSVPIDEARVAAGYAPLNPATKPQTVAELLEAIERLGVDHIMFAENLKDMTPEDLSDILDSIRNSIEHQLLRKKRKEL